MYSAQIRSSRTFLQKQIPSSKTRFLATAILALSSVIWAEPTLTLPEEKATDYMRKVRSCLDNLLEHGTEHK